LAIVMLCTVRASAQCGQPNDGQVHVPVNWETFTPPPEGQSYLDPDFGCTVIRITDSSKDETLWDGSHPSLMHHYSTWSPMNATDTMIMVLSNDGGWRVRNLNGTVAVASTAMPGMDAGHPVWDATNGNVFYHTRANVVYKATIANGVVTDTALYTFTEYSSIVSPDAADLSQDGTQIIVGQNASGTMDVFSWSLSQQSKPAVYHTICTGSVSGSAQPGCIHKLQLSPTNQLIIQFSSDGTGTEQGLRLWNGSSLVHLQDNTSHEDSGYDLTGQSVFIGSNNSYSLSGLINPCASGWGLDVRLLSLLSSAKCLLDNQPYWHVSYRGSASQPWAAFSFFDPRTAGP